MALMGVDAFGSLLAVASRGEGPLAELSAVACMLAIRRFVGTVLMGKR